MLFVEDFEKNNYSGSNPPPERQGVYMITDSRDEVLYVGETENLARREREHKNFDMFKKTEYFLWHELPKNTSDKRRREIETDLIQYYKPPRNKEKLPNSSKQT
ncbi:hypothetical protein TrispH2_004076 [Trichoplax sp. H2]|nr:hypothetical protein TrispH2_004076 [Trichoplax sp. H2]|eukprot:RDD43027.1 hypothetical protein TrispH2_004076 [Trichoplax sp. H2]